MKNAASLKGTSEGTSGGKTTIYARTRGPATLPQGSKTPAMAPLQSDANQSVRTDALIDLLRSSDLSDDQAEAELRHALNFFIALDGARSERQNGENT